MPEYWPAIDAQLDKAKQALVRKLLRLEGKLPEDGRGRKPGLRNYSERDPLDVPKGRKRLGKKSTIQRTIANADELIRRDREE